MTKPNLPQDQLISALNWRYATKQFDATKKLSAGEWKALEEALVLTASSYGLQPYQFQVIQDSALRTTLREQSYNQPQITDCSHLVVFTALKEIDASYIERYIQETAQTRGTSVDALNGYKQMMMGSLVGPEAAARVPEWAARQTYIALGNLLTSAALLGIDVCPMEGIDAAQYDTVLGLTASPYRTVMVAAVGFRSSGDALAAARKVRRTREMLLKYK